MCGIAGLYNFNDLLSGADEASHAVDRMIGTMAHRGPDASGVWVDPQARCVLGHRRLSIIDTSDAGRQPMATADGSWCIAFNGEIYNFLELRDRLAAKGIVPQGRTDTEILLLGLREWGVDFLAMVDGMFAFAAFDTRSGQLILARDAFGEKPLYYVELGGGAIAFASELQALETVPGFDPALSVDAMAEVLMFQYIGAPRSIYRSVRKLPPAHWMTLQGGRQTTGRFFEFRPGAGEMLARPENDLVDELEELLVRSLRRRMIADVPLGAFLSGGVDSSTVCALVRRKLQLPLQTFSIGFKDSAESEHVAAQAFAAHLGTEHHEQILLPDALSFLETVGSVLDEPNADSSCLPTNLLSKFARQFVTVAISGDGGDELFGGYGRYFATLDRFAGTGGARATGAGSFYYSDRILVATDQHIADLFGGVPSGLKAHLEQLRSALDTSPLPLHGALRKTDVENYMPGAVLPKMDRMSMQHSLEVRTPFLNRELALFAEKLPLEHLYSGGVGKRLLRVLAKRYLPGELIDTPKRGFAIPTSQWAPAQMNELSQRMLLGDDSRLGAMFGHDRIAGFLGLHPGAQGAPVFRSWGILMLESWLRHHKASLPDLCTASLVGRSRPAAAAAPVTSPTVVYGRSVAPGLTACLFRPASHDRRAAFAELDAALANEVQLVCLALSRSRAASDAAGAIDAADEHSFAQPLASRPASNRLDGTVLLVVDRASLSRLGSPEFEALRACGVAEIVSFDPHRSDGQVLRTRLRRNALLDTSRLADRWWRHFAPKSVGAVHTGTGHMRSAPIVAPAVAGETNLYNRYAVYVNGVQLPPLPCRDADVAAMGAGRYSIFGAMVTFSYPANVDGGKVVVGIADRQKDNYFTDILPSVVSHDPDFARGDDDDDRVDAATAADLPGTGNSVLLASSIGSQADIERVRQAIAALPKTADRLTVVTVVPPSQAHKEALARSCPARAIDWKCLARDNVGEILAALPVGETARRALWPLWSADGSLAARLVARLRQERPDRLIAVDDELKDYVARLDLLLPTRQAID